MATLWACHPVHAELVVALAGRSVLLALCLMLATSRRSTSSSAPTQRGITIEHQSDSIRADADPAELSGQHGRRVWACVAPIEDPGDLEALIASVDHAAAELGSAPLHKFRRFHVAIAGLHQDALIGRDER